MKWVVVDDDGVAVRVVCGEFWGQRGPVEGVAANRVEQTLLVPEVAVRLRVAAAEAPGEGAQRQPGDHLVFPFPQSRVLDFKSAEIQAPGLGLAGFVDNFGSVQ